MKVAILAFLPLLPCYWADSARAQLELVTNPAPQSVFCGPARPVSVIFHNPGRQDFRQEIRAVISQTTSATAARLGERPWKELHLLPGQTVLESALLDFPTVKAKTKFLVQWAFGKANVLGNSEVLVYPNNLLDDLKLLFNNTNDQPGVLDPHDELKPALRQAAIKFVDLAETALDSFHARLAIVGPFRQDDPEYRDLTARIAKLARNGTPVVWIQSPPANPEKIWPSFFVVPENPSVVVMVDPGLVADLSGNPQSQLKLILLCRLALHPRPPILPELSANP